MRKALFPLLISLLFFATHLQAQTTETFETETGGSTTFVDNATTFTITSTMAGPFDIQAAYPATGWNGTDADSRYIDNDGFAVAGQNVSFKISAPTSFTLKSMWLFLSNNNLSQMVAGSVTLVGSLSGATQFTATASTGFNTGMATNNGYSYIDLSTFGGSNNSNTTIDAITISTGGGNYNYVALDAFRWQTAAAPAATISTHPANRTICLNGNTTFSVAASNATGYQWQVNTGSGYSNVSNTGVYTNATTTTLTITGATAGMTGYLYRCVVTGAGGNATSNGATLTISNPSASGSQTNVACFGISNGYASVSMSGGISPYQYLWSTGATTSAIISLAAGTYTVTSTDNIGCSVTRSFTITQPAALASTFTQTNIACTGGSTGAASVTVSGGAGGYTYDWSGAPTGDGTASITGLAAGTYTVTFTDANTCQGTRTYNITQPTALSSTFTQTNIACNGGSTGAASVTVSGGAGGYNYDWTGAPTGDGTASITGLAAGTYTVTFTDANSCQGTRTYNITQPTALASTYSLTNIACNGGSTGAASVTVSGGTTPYLYDWSGAPTGDGTASITGLTAGTYTVTFTDANACQGTRTYNITQPTALSSTYSQTNVACNSGSTGTASVTVSGGVGGYTYDWSGTPTGDGTSTVSGLTAGTYTVTFTDANACTGSRTFAIVQPTALLASGSQNDVTCAGNDGSATVSVSGGTGGYTYDWTPGNPTGDGTATITGLSANTFTVTYTDANSCQGTRTFTIAGASSCTPTWTGTGNWTDNPNWTNNPQATDSVVIQSGVLTVNTDVTVNDLTLENGTSLVVVPGSTLTITGNLIDNGGTFTVQTGGSIIFEGDMKKAAVTRLKTYGKVKVMSGSLRLMN